MVCPLLYSSSNEFSTCDYNQALLFVLQFKCQRFVPMEVHGEGEDSVASRRAKSWITGLFDKDSAWVVQIRKNNPWYLNMIKLENIISPEFNLLFFQI